MIELFGFQIDLDRLGVVTTLSLFAIAVITDKLVWHRRLAREIERADRWESIALEALSSGAQAGVNAAEVAASVVAALPDPAAYDRPGEVDS